MEENEYILIHDDSSCAFDINSYSPEIRKRFEEMMREIKQTRIKKKKRKTGLRLKK